MKIIEVLNLKKVYDPYGISPKSALDNIDLDVEDGEFICVMGASGSGKTTLINILSSIDDATAGTVIIDGKNLALMSEKEKAVLRKSKIGFIFQNYNLIESLTIKDNILFSMRLNHVSVNIQLMELTKIAKQLGIEDILTKYPSECSGGQQQRAAIARALIMKPKIIFADEPTGNLDSLNAKELMELFAKINCNNNTTIVMVSHDSFVASYSMKMYYMEDGKFSESVVRNGMSQELYYAKIVKITSKLDLTINK